MSNTMVRLFLNDEFEKMWNKVVVNYIEVSTQNLPKGMEEKQPNPTTK
jgi:hypothetical protein